MFINIHSYIADAVDQYLSQDNKYNERVESDFSKIKKSLIDFAHSQNMSLEKLAFLHICDFIGETKLGPEFLKFVASMDHTESYKTQIRTRTKGLIKILFNQDDEFNNISNEVDLGSPIPKFLVPILEFLPKCRSSKSSLSIISRYVLLAVLTIVYRYNINDLHTLFNKHRSDICKCIKDVTPRQKVSTVKSSFYTLINKSRALVEIVINEAISLPLKEFPPLLRKQVEVFRINAQTGLNHDVVLNALATEKGISLYPLSNSTIKLTIESLQLGLGKLKCLLSEDLEIRDFLRLRTSVSIDSDGDESIYRYNPLIDALRKIERERFSRFKNSGFDSGFFKLFLTSVKSVATFNSIFKFRESFNETYKINLDVKTIESSRENKKVIFRLDWIDSEISRLLPEFRDVAKKRLFKPDLTKCSSAESARNMRFCLFFVELVTLRYMGLRQKQIRKCKLNDNIVFHSNGAISFHWTKTIMKNKKDYRATISPEKHSATHGVLIEVLNLYHSIIYPYIYKVAKTTIGNDFFVAVERNQTIVKISDEDAGVFCARFERRVDSFLDLSMIDIDKEKLPINPHFLRGVCVDWLFYELNVSLRNVADYIDDSEKTVLKHYLKKNITVNAQAALDEANQNIRLNKVISDILKNFSPDSDFHT